jgi:hypothetical protein
LRPASVALAGAAASAARPSNARQAAPKRRPRRIASVTGRGCVSLTASPRGSRGRRFRGQLRCVALFAAASCRAPRDLRDLCRTRTRSPSATKTQRSVPPQHKVSCQHARGSGSTLAERSTSPRDLIDPVRFATTRTFGRHDPRTGAGAPRVRRETPRQDFSGVGRHAHAVEQRRHPAA